MSGFQPLKQLGPVVMLVSALLVAMPANAFDTSWNVPELSEVQAVIDDGSYDEAIGLLRQVLDEEPDNADALNLMGFAQRKAGRLERAETFYLKVMEIEPDHLGMLAYLGELYVETGRITEAEANLKRLLDLCGIECDAYLSLEKAIADAG